MKIVEVQKAVEARTWFPLTQMQNRVRKVVEARIWIPLAQMQNRVRSPADVRIQLYQSIPVHLSQAHQAVLEQM